jgi:LuxR family transcriptional regulator, maltose regulon positive regulatory protein
MLQASLRDAENAINRVLDVLDRAAEVAEVPGHVRLPSELASPPGQSGPTVGLAGTNELAGRLLAVLHDLLSTGVPRPIHPAPTQQVASGPLTGREAEVLDYLSARLSNKEIAERLSISPHTVKRHTISLYQKLGVQGRRQAVAQARMHGLLP